MMNGRYWELFGKMHVIIVHFPIALLIVAAAVEAWCVLRRRPVSPTARVCLYLGTIATVVAVGMGWVDARFNSFTGDAGKVLLWHRWLGVGVAGAAIVLALFTAITSASVGKKLWMYRGGLLACALMVGLVGHYGGALVHGSDFLTLAPADSDNSVMTVSNTGPVVPADGKIDYGRDVQPILAQNCYSCHSYKAKRGNLRLDGEKLALAGGNSGPAIIPGDADHSPLIRRVLGQDKKAIMPMDAKPLSDVQVKILHDWVAQGAHWSKAANQEPLPDQKHWAYIAPVRPALPVIKDPEHWAKNPIDVFVRARLEQEGLKPSPEAGKATLLRRVCLDLTGLPPTPAEADAYLADDSPDAYEKLVDRLLASPHYGEKWAHHWLDLARYADSNGYEKDLARSIWPYRDWVINALNADMPFDQFTIRQLAGDLLPNATLEDRIATGFQRNTMLNTEGGVDPEEFRYLAEVDRVNTTAATWLASTINCCQCHDHKYDPFLQKDYYQLLAFYNSTDPETDSVGNSDTRDISTKLELPNPERDKLLAQVAAIKQQMESSPELAQDQRNWEQQIGAFQNWKPLELSSYTSDGGAVLTARPDHSLLVSGENPDTASYDIVGSTDLHAVAGIELEALTDASFPNQGPGRSVQGNFVLTHISVSIEDSSATTQPAIALVNPTADYSQADYPVASALSDANPNPAGWAVADKWGMAHTAVFQFEHPVEIPAGAKLKIVLDQKSNWPKHTLGAFRLSLTGEPSPAVAPKSNVPARILNLVRIPEAKRTADQSAKIAAYYQTIAPRLEPLRKQSAELQKQADALKVTTLVMHELDKPRPTHIHIRGAFLTEAEQVEPGTPAILNSFSPTLPRNRLGLAEWIVDPANPLTARVEVNRLWEQYFGRGIVGTSEDFGTRGDLPTHPELLDWLATELVRDKWSLKAIHRLIVTSATYRQQSSVTPDLLEKDPANKLLARGPRVRLDAEAIRDQSLLVSDLLSPKLGGPGVFPYQPDGIWNVVYNGSTWKNSTGGDQYRRGIYTFWRRSTPYPSFATFDATSREVICTRRSRTDTPLQAMTTLNDPAFVQPAAALARLIVRDGGAKPADRIIYGFRRVLVRLPNDQEMGRLLGLYNQMIDAYRKDPAAAKELAAGGLTQPLPKDADASELAAWTAVSNVLLNLDEAMTKE